MSIENVNLQHKRLSDADFASTTPLDGQFIIRTSDMTLKTGVGNQCAFINLKALQNVCQIGNDMCWMGNTVYHSGNDGAGSNLDAGLFCGIDLCTIDNRYLKKTNQGIGSGLDADMLDGVQSNINKVANTIPIRNASGCMIGDISGNANTLGGVTYANIFATNSDVVVGTCNTQAVSPCSLSYLFSALNRQSLGSTGYQRFPGGIIIQWGVASISSSAFSTSITFVPAFTTVYNISALYNITSGSLLSGNLGPYVSSVTETGFQVRGNTYGSSEVGYAYWFAIGV